MEHFAARDEPQRSESKFWENLTAVEVRIVYAQLFVLIFVLGLLMLKRQIRNCAGWARRKLQKVEADKDMDVEATGHRVCARDRHVHRLVKCISHMHQIREANRTFLEVRSQYNGYVSGKRDGVQFLADQVMINDEMLRFDCREMIEKILIIKKSQPTHNFSECIPQLRKIMVESCERIALREKYPYNVIMYEVRPEIGEGSAASLVRKTIKVKFAKTWRQQMDTLSEQLFFLYKRLDEVEAISAFTLKKFEKNRVLHVETILAKTFLKQLLTRLMTGRKNEDAGIPEPWCKNAVLFRSFFSHPVDPLPDWIAIEENKKQPLLFREERDPRSVEKRDDRKAKPRRPAKAAQKPRKVEQDPEESALSASWSRRSKVSKAKEKGSVDKDKKVDVKKKDGSEKKDKKGSVRRSKESADKEKAKSGKKSKKDKKAPEERQSELQRQFDAKLP